MTATTNLILTVFMCVLFSAGTLGILVIAWSFFEGTKLGKIFIDRIKGQEEIIRCKDCKYNNGGRCGWHGGAGYKWVVDDDDFCSCGERRTE